jgi:hypothetical protein
MECPPIIPQLIDPKDCDRKSISKRSYGQTGSGKTYTMLGEADNKGLISRSISKLFNAKQEIEALSRGNTKVELGLAWLGLAWLG